MLQCGGEVVRWFNAVLRFPPNLPHMLHRWAAPPHPASPRHPRIHPPTHPPTRPPQQGGFLVVDGVLASAHSDWVLDAIAPAALRHLLPHAYQAAFKPITWMYHLLGPRRLERLTDAAVPVLLANTAALAAALQLALATGALGMCLGASVWASKPLRARK